MKYLIYLASGMLFSMGLLLSGMADPNKVKSFLSIGTSVWSPALLFVLGSAVLVYLAFFLFLKRRGRSLNGAPFANPKPRPADRKLVMGSVLFGVGWGLAGLCPGPALLSLVFLKVEVVAFVVTMIVGFELQRRIS